MINVQRLEMELIHMPHTSDNDKKHAIIMQSAHKNEQEQKIFSKVSVRILKRPITFDPIVHQHNC